MVSTWLFYILVDQCFCTACMALSFCWGPSQNLTGEALEGLASGVGSGLDSAKDYAGQAGDKIAETNTSVESSAQDAQHRAVEGMRSAGTQIAGGLSSAEKKAEDAWHSARDKLGV